MNNETLLNALTGVIDPARGRDIVSLDMVEAAHLSADHAALVTLRVDPARGTELEALRQKAEAALSAVPGIRSARVILTAERDTSAPAQRRADPHGMEKNPRLVLPIRVIIAVASGKGGVGKSTVAANLAVALARQGYKTGLLDADIYGPSVPLMMGVQGRKPETTPDQKPVPLMAHGVHVMSIGLMIDGTAPLIWRGPMVQTAVYQLLRDVAWGTPEDPLDVLLIDMPPGTGDAALTLAQKVPVDGAIIVSTPQDIALIDARKAVAMFQKTGVSILGLIENMSTYICPACGHEDHIFGHGGAQAEAGMLGIPFLGEIPLSLFVRQHADDGLPCVAAAETDSGAQAFLQIAERLVRMNVLKVKGGS